MPIFATAGNITTDETGRRTSVPAGGLTSSLGGGAGVTPTPGAPAAPAAGAAGLDVGTAFEEVRTTLAELKDQAQDFIDPEKLAAPFKEAFAKTSSAAEEAARVETLAAEQDLRAFLNNNPDVRGATSLGVARRIKADLLNATIRAGSDVFNTFADKLFTATQAAGTNFANFQSTVLEASGGLASATADYVATLSGVAAQNYGNQLQFASQMADISARRDIARMQDATNRLEIAQRGNTATSRQTSRQVTGAGRPASSSPSPAPTTASIAEQIAALRRATARPNLDRNFRRSGSTTLTPIF